MIQMAAVLGLLFTFWLLFFFADKLGSLGGWFIQGTRIFNQWLVSFGTLALGIILIGSFLIFEMGYFTLFEYFWSGATPGKRYLNVRVIRQDARPMTFIDSAVRNLLRFVDLLGQMYPIGLVIMFIDVRNRRLGDLAAGTLVVIERPTKAPFLVGPGKELTSLDPHVRSAALAMTPEDYQLIARFLARREGLAPEHRAELIQDIYARVFKSRPDPHAGERNTERALETVAAQYLDKTRIL
jgi:uncharacterized RDD family membrane protein YckC